MDKIKLCIIREGKIPIDRRVPFTPLQAKEITKKFPHVNVVCQRSRVRCFKDEEYAENGIEIVTEIFDCDILMGIKEVPLSNLIGGKTYLFFSHTIKKQPHNRKLLQTILKKNITLVDYETLQDKKGNRLVAFGRYAGIVGAYNGLWTYGKRYNLYTIRRAHQCFDLKDLQTEYEKIKLPPIKIALTGGGRVGKGSEEVLDGVGIKKVSPDEFINKEFLFPVYVQLNSSDYHVRIEGGPFDREEFHQHPERYASNFKQYAMVADILVAGAYWHPKAPRLYSREDMMDSEFKIRVIADISCDINGSMPSTVKSCTIDDPVYDYDVENNNAVPPFSNKNFITVMAIDNLPCELPRSASEDFGRDLIDKVLPSLLIKDKEQIIERATIAHNGSLTKGFAYLEDYSALH